MIKKEIIAHQGGGKHVMSKNMGKYNRFFFYFVLVVPQYFMLAKLTLKLELHLQCGYFEDGVLRIICLGCPQTLVLPISASQVAGIAGMSHWWPKIGFAFLG
jgi:hypothetical protein